MSDSSRNLHENHRARVRKRFEHEGLKTFADHNVLELFLFYSIPQKDLKKFTEQAKRYGVLYCVLRDKNTKGENAPVDIIARAEDASKIQRIVERFELGKVDKASIVSEAEKAIADREAVEKEKPTKSKSEIIMEEAVRNPMQ